MRKIFYKPGRAAFATLGFAAAALVSWRMIDDDSGLIEWLALLVFGAATLVSARQALGSHPAIECDDDGLKLSHFFGRRSVRWSDVQQVSLMTLVTRMWGLIPIRRQEQIEIRAGGKRHRYLASAIELPPGGLGAIKDEIDRRASTAPTAPAATSVAGAERGEASSEFDPDAAIERYLANKRAGEASASAKSPSPAPVGLAARPRPVFGRRTG